MWRRRFLQNIRNRPHVCAMLWPSKPQCYEPSLWQPEASGVGKFLGVISKLRKAAVSFVMSVRLSARFQGTVRLPLGEFSWNCYLRICRKSIEKMQDSLKSDKNDGYFTWIPMYICDTRSLSINSSQSELCFGHNCIGNQNTHFVFNEFFFSENLFVFEIVWKVS